MIFCELLINLVLYVAALRMMDLQQLIEAYSQTIADVRAMQQALKEMAITVAYLQQGNGVKPIVTFSYRNSKVPGDIKLGNLNCPKKGRGSWKGKNEDKSFTKPSLCWWCKGKVPHDRAQHEIQDCHLFRECKENYWKDQKGNENKTAPSPPSKLTLHIETISKTEGLKAVLYQVQKGVKRVIAYASRSVNKTEMNYPVHKLEFLALKWAITDKFHDYLYGGNTFDVYTDITH